MALDFHVLGPAEVLADGQPVPLGGSRPLIVLAGLLLRANQAVSVDELGRWLWGDDSRHSKGALQTYVLRVRRALGDAVAIRTERGGYLLEVDEDALDLTRFRKLAAQGKSAVERGELRQGAALFDAALAEWRGRPLLNVDSDTLLLDEAGQLTEERLRVREQWADTQLALGDYATVIPELTTLSRENPLRERLHEQLMIALHRTGRQAEALAVYQQISAVLAEELGLDPGPSLRRSRQSILTGQEPGTVAVDAGLARYRLGAEPLIPRQLPAELSGFAGRELDLKALHSLVPEALDTTTSTPIASIEGMGGIGKTTLAVHFAHEVGDRFPGGHVYLNLRGNGPGEPVEPAAALETVLSALGVPTDQIPGDLDGRAATWRTHTAGRRMLILLDNVNSTEQVRPLLPGPGCLVLVTSRWQLRALVATHGAKRVALEELAEEDAIALLVSTIGVERVSADCAASERFVRYCGGLPLAIRILAVRAAQFPDVPLGEFVAGLEAGQDRLSSFDLADGDETNIRTVFSSSYQALSPEPARLLRLLGLSTGVDFSVPAAAAIARVDLTQARMSLAKLASAHLIGQPRPGRFQFHDLIRAYAGELSQRLDDDAARREALDGMLAWYRSSALNASRVLRPERYYRLVGHDDGGGLRFDCYNQALDWLDEESGNLVAAVHLAHRDGRFEVCWQLAWLLQPYFLVRAKLDDWRAVCELALRAARADRNRPGEAAILSSLGVANGVARAFKEAIRYLREVLEIQLELGEREGAARALYNLSLAAYSDSDFDIALEWGSEALRIVRELNLGNFEADALQNLGSICVSRGEFVQALDFVDSALAIWEHNGTSEAARFAYETRGRALIGLGRAEEGIRSEERAVEMHFSRSELYEAATVLTQLGTNHLRLGSPHLAREHWLRAVRLLTEISHPYAGEVRAKLAALVAGQA